jgi:hypothetical protein
MIPKVAMPRLDIEAFVSAVERLGLRLSAAPLADGKVRLNRWRMPDAVLNTQKIEDLWAARIGDDQARIAELAAHVMRRTGAARHSERRVGSDRH